MTRPRESKIEDHLRDQVRATGGEHRKCAWLGRRGAPDEFCMWPGVHAWAEVKRPGETATAQQAREHERMRRAGCLVYVVSTIAEVDEFVAQMEALSKRRQDEEAALRDTMRINDMMMEITR